MGAIPMTPFAFKRYPKEKNLMYYAIIDRKSFRIMTTRYILTEARESLRFWEQFTGDIGGFIIRSMSDYKEIPS